MGLAQARPNEQNLEIVERMRVGNGKQLIILEWPYSLARQPLLPKEGERVWSNASRRGHCIGICTSTRDRRQSEVKQSRRNSEGGQTVKQGIEGSLEKVKAAPGAPWAWLMLDSQGSRLDFWSGQGVKLKNLMGQDLDPGRGWKYRCLCSVTPLC